MVLFALLLAAALSGDLPAGEALVSPPWDEPVSFPARYDLRAFDLVTPVRWQESHGTCWVMSALGSLESAVLRADGVACDFSENNLANHMASRLDFEGFAPAELAAAYFARWEGPVLEADDPYPRPGRSPEYLRAVRHVGEVLMLPQRTGPYDNDAVKWAVSTHGGVDAAIDFDTGEDERFWNAETSSYYSTRGVLDHHVTCVGWDDAYPASRFATRPPGDGAFLIKNSWGADFGQSGYFWLSYHDTGFGRALAVFGGATADGLDAIYQYDGLGRTAWLGLGGERAWFANRFRCAGSGSVAAVSLYTPVAGCRYEIHVAASVDGVATAPVAASGVAEVAGYHTIRLARPVEVANGDDFVVAAHVVSPGWSDPVPVEHPSALIDPRARRGQSYVSTDGSSWTDLVSRPGFSRSNVCLKAFVAARGAGDTRPPRVVVAGGRVRRGATVRVRWALRDPAFSSASAIVVLVVRDARGRLVQKLRVPAVCVGERGVWKLAARWPAGRYTITGRAYDVAGRRQVRASRAMLLVSRGVARR